MICSMMLDDLGEWIKTKAQPGDIAYGRSHYNDRRYLYVYKGPDDSPCWITLQDDIVDKYLEEINKLKVEETKMNKRCDNCKHFKNISGSFTWCSHKEHAGTPVPAFTACTDHEPKQLTGPFDNLKFFIKDQKTGELTVKYICDDCSKVMDEPFHWWYALPIKLDTGNSRSPGYHFRCEECDNKKKAMEGR